MTVANVQNNCVYDITALSSGRVVNTPVLYLESPRFKSLPRDQLFWLNFFMVFPSPSRNILE
jgi:hypothetical protein